MFKIKLVNTMPYDYMQKKIRLVYLLGVHTILPLFFMCIFSKFIYGETHCLAPASNMEDVHDLAKIERIKAKVDDESKQIDFKEDVDGAIALEIKSKTIPDIDNDELVSATWALLLKRKDIIKGLQFLAEDEDEQLGKDLVNNLNLLQSDDENITHLLKFGSELTAILHEYLQKRGWMDDAGNLDEFFLYNFLQFSYNVFSSAFAEVVRRFNADLSSLQSELDFGDALLKKLTVSAYELMGNIYRHSNGGFITLRKIYDASNNVIGLEIVAADCGKGISFDRFVGTEDQIWLMLSGQAESPGIGLSTVIGNSDYFALNSVKDGNKVVLRFFFENNNTSHQDNTNLDIAA